MLLHDRGYGYYRDTLGQGDRTLLNSKYYRRVGCPWNLIKCLMILAIAQEIMLMAFRSVVEKHSLNLEELS